MTLLHLTVKAQKEHIVHWTQLLRVFPLQVVKKLRHLL